MNLLPALCPVCHHTLAVPFFDGGAQPLSTLGWPTSVTEAQAMPRFPLNYVQCPRCTHVWNRAFDYDAVPYSSNPNRMYNAGTIWRGHLAATRDLLLDRLPEAPTVVDIGCGEGHFVRGLSKALNGVGCFTGFDPNATEESGCGVEFHARYFEPLQDMPLLQPDALVMRHVLEHLIDPAAFVEQMAWGAAQVAKPVWLFVEMPCIDRVMSSGRIVDFYWEHPSQFTTESFRTLMERAGKVVELSHGYGGEVVYALVRLGVPTCWSTQAQTTQSFAQQVPVSRDRIGLQLDELAASGQAVAIWGGTGKAAAFIHQFGADAKRFPLVVDSDPDKTGTFVPGTGQQIVFRDILKTAPVDVVIIPTQWRARDIVSEMKSEQIRVRLVLIEHKGRLMDFHNDPHPYK